MNKDQEYTPKYWVAQQSGSDDVILSTASKSLTQTELLAMEHFGEFEFYNGLEDSSIEIVIIEIKLVDM